MPPLAGPATPPHGPSSPYPPRCARALPACRVPASTAFFARCAPGSAAPSYPRLWLVCGHKARNATRTQPQKRRQKKGRGREAARPQKLAAAGTRAQQNERGQRAVRNEAEHDGRSAEAE